ncbi:sensor histidine kinase [Terrimonas sp. NA20]|uniref:histidine kinase n=1 Tax=Terrimonas ginsenosidimutans TaxID=2908004 RepID=A0ABS9KS20_9BACT|nr:sensor histidine kinase [Terrimonas ginsenosidimutans]MCG2615092.1 sensor histidine kinase [Terrimonas ginsenosidimutans]
MNSVLSLAVIISVIITAAVVLLSCRFYVAGIRRKADQLVLEKQSSIIKITHLSERLAEDKKWLMQEIHHRVKNNLQIIMSLLNSQSAFLKDNAAIAAIRTSKQRVSAMSLIHKRLYTEEDLSGICLRDYVMELLEFLKESFQLDREIRFVVNVEKVKTDATTAIPLGLILNEAITNAITHAFPSGKGEVSISIQVDHRRQLNVIVEDNGIGIPASVSLSSPGSFGMKLIKGLAGELNASLELDGKQTGGTVIRLSFTCKEYVLC